MIMFNLLMLGAIISQGIRAEWISGK